LQRLLSNIGILLAPIKTSKTGIPKENSVRMEAVTSCQLLAQSPNCKPPHTLRYCVFNSHSYPNRHGQTVCAVSNLKMHHAIISRSLLETLRK
jgi:hypothetical protein